MSKTIKDTLGKPLRHSQNRMMGEHIDEAVRRGVDLDTLDVADSGPSHVGSKTDKGYLTTEHVGGGKYKHDFTKWSDWT